MIHIYKPKAELDDCDREWDFQSFLSELRNNNNFDNALFLHNKKDIVEDILVYCDNHDYNKPLTCVINDIITIETSESNHSFINVYESYVKSNSDKYERFDNINEHIGFFKAIKLGVQHLNYDSFYQYLLKDKELLIKFI